MHLRIISIGKIKQGFVLGGEEEYLKRIKPWTSLELKELPTERLASIPDTKRQEEESKLFLKAIESTDFVVVLDERGKARTSHEFADFFRDKMNEGVGRVVFGIGGAMGWHDATRKRANLLLSLSPMTFTYQMTRLILIEQIYRALAIVKGTPYHK